MARIRKAKGGGLSIQRGTRPSRPAKILGTRKALHVEGLNTSQMHKQVSPPNFRASRGFREAQAWSGKRPISLLRVLLPLRFAQGLLRTTLPPLAANSPFWAEMTDGLILARSQRPQRWGSRERRIRHCVPALLSRCAWVRPPETSSS